MMTSTRLRPVKLTGPPAAAATLSLDNSCPP
jgi:hypothetical protein